MDEEVYCDEKALAEHSLDDMMEEQKNVGDEAVVGGIRRPGRYDALLESEAEAVRLARLAMPDATELPRARTGVPYPAPPLGVKKWIQSHPPEPEVGHDLPHIKYADWSGGKKDRGGSWGHLFHPPRSE